MASKLLKFKIQAQSQDFWCWAAVSASIGEYYDKKSWKQCTVASDVLNEGCCDNHFPETVCNVPSKLTPALESVYHGDASNPLQIIDASKIRDELDAEHPIGVRIEWSDCSGHFVVIYGYEDGPDNTLVLNIADPWLGVTSVIEFSEFPLDASWTNSYYTR